MEVMNIRKIIYDDYNKGYLLLLLQFKNFDISSYTFESFCDKLDNMIGIQNDQYNSKSKIYVIEDNNKIIATGKILFEDKFYGKS